MKWSLALPACLELSLALTNDFQRCLSFENRMAVTSRVVFLVLVNKTHQQSLYERLDTKKRVGELDVSRRFWRGNPTFT
jgi:hypothetical protein